MNEFSKNFAEYSIIFIVDYFADYYQIPLDRFSRDLIAFINLLRLVRMTRLPQGWINSVTKFIYIIKRVYYRQIPREMRSFIDDIDIKDLKNKYNDEKISSDVR